MKLATALKLGRVSNLPTVWTNCIAGAVLSMGLLGAGIDLRVIAAIVAMTFSYVGGMFLNDAFDAKIDAKERPERPIPSGEVSRQHVFVWGFSLLGLSVLLLALSGLLTSQNASAGLNVKPALAGIVLAACIVLYNSYHKNNPLSPVIMGLCRVCVYAVAALVVVDALPASVYTGSVLLLCYLIGLTYIAKQENLGSVKNLWPLLFLLAPLLYGAACLIGIISTPVQGESSWVLLFWLVLTLWTGFCVYLVKRRQAGDIPRAVVSLIAGISLLDALLVSLHGSTVLALLCCVGFGLTLVFQRFVAGT